MNAFIQHLFDSFFGNIRYKLLRQLWHIVNGVRCFFIMIFFSIFSLMMMTLGLFGSLAYLFYQLGHQNEVQFDSLLLFMSGDFLFFLILLIILFRKKMWLKASGLAKHFETL